MYSHLDWIANTSFIIENPVCCPCSDLAWVKLKQSRVLVSFVFFSIPLRSAQLLTVYLEREAKHASFNQEHSRRRDGNISHLRAKKCISQAITQCELSLFLSLTHTYTVLPTQRHDTASLRTTCKFVLWPSEPCGEDRLTLHSDGSQDAILNLNISADDDANTYCVTYTLHPLCLSLTPLTPFVCHHYPVLSITGDTLENELHCPASHTAPVRASTVLKTE